MLRWAAVVVAAGCGLAGAALARAQSVADWVAPPETQRLLSPVARTPDNLKKGRSLFVKHCTMCHGERGRGDGPSARLHARRSGHAPRDLTRADVQAGLTDGEMFWKIGLGWKLEGRVIMPGLGEETSEEDRWRLVLYVRSLAKGGVP